MKLLLLSLVVATVVVPTFAARQGNPRRGLKVAVLGMAAVLAAYLLVLGGMQAP